MGLPARPRQPTLLRPPTPRAGAAPPHRQVVVLCHHRHTTGVPRATVLRAPHTNDGRMGCPTITSGETDPNPATGQACNHRPGSRGSAFPVSGIAWSFCNLMLLAAVVIVFGSETQDGPSQVEPLTQATAQAISPTASPTISPTASPTISPTAPPTASSGVDRTTTSWSAPEHRPVRFTTAVSVTGDQGAEGESRRHPAPGNTARSASRQRTETETETETEKIVPLVRPVVMLYGDSLAWEARQVFENALADQPVEVVTRTFGGTAICDWHDEMTEDAATLRPGLVVIEFVGNNYTSCMQDPAGDALVGAALVDRYTADAETAIATFASIDAQVVLAGAPIARPATATLDLHHAPLNVVYEELGSTSRRRPLRGRRRIDTRRRRSGPPRCHASGLEPCAGRERRLGRRDQRRFVLRTGCTSARRAPRRTAGSPAIARCGRAGHSGTGQRSPGRCSRASLRRSDRRAVRDHRPTLRRPSSRYEAAGGVKLQARSISRRVPKPVAPFE